MATMQAIRARIKSVTSTQQITRAMKMVAASKLRKVQGRMMAVREYDNYGREILKHLLIDSDIELNNPFTTPRKEVKKVAYVLIVGNRGLCGMYNSAVLHMLTDIMKEETRPYEVIVCGKWGKEVFKHRGIPVVKTFDELSDTPSILDCLEISDYLKQAYLNEDYDEIHLVYQTYVSALSQVPKNYQILPKEPQDIAVHAGFDYKPPFETDEDDPDDEPVIEYDYLYEPDRDTFVDSFMDLYIARRFQEALLEAKCAEHSARVQAMTSASDNTEKLIAKLQLFYNRARQAAITTEISEIVGGASALKKKRGK